MSEIRSKFISKCPSESHNQIDTLIMKLARARITTENNTLKLFQAKPDYFNEMVKQESVLICSTKFQF